MLAILNSLNAHNFLIFQPILMTLASIFMVYRALSDKTYLLAHLSRRLIGELIVYQWSGVRRRLPSVVVVRPLSSSVVVHNAQTSSSQKPLGRSNLI